MREKGQVFAVGLGLTIVGAVLLANGYNMALDDPSRSDFIGFGYAVGALGGLFLQVGVIAWGVELGTRRMWDPAAFAAPAARSGKVRTGRVDPMTWIVGGVVAVCAAVLVGVAMVAF